MRLTLLILVSSMLAAGVGAGETNPVGKVAVIPAPVPAENCFLPVAKRCCKDAGATLSVPCSADGVQWTCTSTPTQNDLFQTTKPSATGWTLSVETGRTFKCVYRKVSCGPSVGTCSYGVSTTLSCAEKGVDGPLCESAAE